MSYLPITLNHFRAVKEWADSCGALVSLDVKSFDLRVQVGQRYCMLKPRFLMMHEGKMAYTTQLVKDVTGFIGWLPYDVLGWDLSQHKLLAKRFFKDAALKFPAAWNSLAEIDGDFVIKSKAGSFGYQVKGPFRLTEKTVVFEAATTTHNNPANNFAEQFVYGDNLKVWFWGATAVYAQVHAYPRITGDGVSSVLSLIESRLAEAGAKAISETDRKNLYSALDFQKIQATDTLALNQQVWIDFRYGRRYLPTSLELESDSDLESTDPQVRQQIDLAGIKVANEAMLRFKRPVLYSLDGVVDATGCVWWLEINSNPMFPPDAYPLVFSSLFALVGTSTK